MTVGRQQITCILADLDDTCYENTTMQHQVAENIRAYMAEKLGIAADEVAEKCADYYLTYGTTLAGLVANGYTIDYDDWHAHVHGSLTYEEYLKPDPTLRRLLNSIPLPKYIFTNADTTHAARCLDLLGIADCFQGVIAFEDIMAAAEQAGMVHHGRPVVCKPNRQAFDLALQLAGDAEASTTLWLDDSARNISTGHKMGMYSVLVGRTGVSCPADQQIRHVHDLPAVLPWLWQGQQPPLPAPLLEDASAELASDATRAVKVPPAAAALGADKGPAADYAAKVGARKSSQEGEIEALYVTA